MSGTGISNFETPPAEEKKIQEGTGIPHELLLERLDNCAKQEGLKDGYFSSDADINQVLAKAGWVEMLELPPRIRLNTYLQGKYGEYLWRGYNKNHRHE